MSFENFELWYSKKDHGKITVRDYIIYFISNRLIEKWHVNLIELLHQFLRSSTKLYFSIYSSLDKALSFSIVLIIIYGVLNGTYPSI